MYQDFHICNNFETKNHLITDQLTRDVNSYLFKKFGKSTYKQFSLRANWVAVHPPGQF